MNRKPFLVALAELLAAYRPHLNLRRLRLTGWLPTRGNVIFTLAMIALLIAAQSVGALPLGRPQAAPEAASTGTIAYQGRLADAAGAPLTGTYNMTFRLYTGATGGTPLWSEPWTGSNGVKVSDGLFDVMLGSLTALPQSAIAGRSQLFLGITVGTDDEMQPRVQLGSVPFAVQALTVPDGSVTTGKIANGAVTQAKAPTLVSSLDLRSNVRVYYWGNQIPPTGYLIQWPHPFPGDVSVVATPWLGEGTGFPVIAVLTNPPGKQNLNTGAVVHLFDVTGNQIGGYVKVIAIGN